MSNDSQNSREKAQPVITKELARELAREGEDLRRQYSRRVQAMWAIGRDDRQTRSK